MSENASEVGKLFHEFKRLNDERLNASEARAKEIDAMLAKINERMDAAETKISRPATKPAHEQVDEQEKDLRVAQAKAFRKLAVGGMGALNTEESKALQTRVVKGPGGVKALSTDNLTTGGYLVPMNLSSEIAMLLKEFDPIRQLADVESISKGDSWEGLKEGTTAFGSSWVGQRGSRAETAAGTFEKDRIPVHEQYANPFVTQTQLDDEDFPLESYIAARVSEEFGLDECAAFVDGNGVGKPLGFLSALPGSTAVGTVAGGVSASINTDDLLSLIAALPERYAANAAMLMRRATKFVVRKLKDGNGQYLWQPSMQIGTPPTFDGIPVHEAPNMPAVGASAKSVVLADWKRFYKIIDRQGIVTRPDPFTNKPYIEMYTTRRVGGQVRLPEAGKILVCGA